MLYIIKTKSVFEHIYVIEAPAKSIATAMVMEETAPSNFFQKHLGETIVEVAEAKSGETAVVVDKIRKQGYV